MTTTISNTITTTVDLGNGVFARRVTVTSQGMVLPATYGASGIYAALPAPA